MGSRILTHQLSNGLYVSGPPEQPKERAPTMTSTAVPYTGGDVTKSGELGKMFDIPVDGSRSRKSGPVSGPPSRSGSFAGANSLKKSNSGPLTRQGDQGKKSSGPLSGGMTPSSRQNSGSLAPILPTTGLITSGPISSGPLNSSGAPRKASGPLDSKASVAHNQAITILNRDNDYSFQKDFPKIIFWSVILLFLMGFIAGGFILGAVHNAILIIVIIVLFGAIAILFIWNGYWSKKAIVKYIERYSDSELRTAKNGQFVKISGVVTCGNVPLESSFQKIPRCVYTSTCLYEYRGWESKSANSKHRRFTWGLRSMERRAVDFYISDFQSGLRALVKTGYGARVTPYVDDSIVAEINSENNDSSPGFLTWLGQKNLSADDRTMRLKEGYIKEGSAVSVMGVVQRNESIVMIVPPPEPVSTGCQWLQCIVPASLEGIVLRCEDASSDVIPV